MAALKAIFSTLCLALGAVAGFVAHDCPPDAIFKPLPDYDLTKAAGEWHSYGAIVTSPIFQAFNTSMPVDDSMAQCVETNEDYIANNQTMMVLVKTKRADSTVNQHYAEHYEKPTLGEYKIHSEDERMTQFKDMSLFILATDYDSYMIKYSCIYLEVIFPYQMITISIREKKASEKTLKTIEEALEKLDLRLKYVHLSCK